MQNHLKQKLFQVILFLTVAIVVLFYLFEPTLNIKEIPVKFNENNKSNLYNLTTTFTTTTLTTVNEEIHEGFVTFATKSHFELLKVLVESIHNFSTRHIIAFGLDDDVPFKYARLINRRISVSECGASIYFCKPYTIWKSNLTYGVYLDVDGVVNYNIDILFDIARVWKGNHTINPIHPQDPNNQDFFMQNQGVTKKSMPYVHGHVIWNYLSINFVKQWFDLCPQVMGSNFDETALNILLWKINAKHLAAAYDPYVGFVYEYFDDKVTKEPVPYFDLLFHGGKVANESEYILRKLIKYHETGHKIQTLDNGEYCPADRRTKKTALHPLLCEYID